MIGNLASNNRFKVEGARKIAHQNSTFRDDQDLIEVVLCYLWKLFRNSRKKNHLFSFIANV